MGGERDHPLIADNGAVNTHSGPVLTVHSAAMAVEVLLFIAVAALLAYGAVTYRRAGSTPAVTGARPGANMRLEVLWTSIAALLLLVVFWLAR
jgi:heme/copper-type cytochrome/quinol oxidase subunit 2